MTLVVPDEAEQAFIHDKYMTELLKGLLRPETRERLLAIVAQMKARDGIDAVILAGTELPLILRDPHGVGHPAARHDGDSRQGDRGGGRGASRPWRRPRPSTTSTSTSPMRIGTATSR